MGLNKHISVIRVMCEFQKLLYMVHVPKEGGRKYFFKKETKLCGRKIHEN